MGSALPLGPMAATQMERATSFGAVAESYDRFRPAPPPEAAEWLLPEGARRVADVGAGTGGFSRVLAGLVDQVVAVELDVRMATLLRDRSPGVAVVNGRGEALPIGPACLDAVLVSAAWHWLDVDRMVPEVARVLRPGGVLGVLWSGPQRRVDWVAELLGRDRGNAVGSRRELRIPDGWPFSVPESRVIDWSLGRAPSELVGLAATYSRVITLAPEDRQADAERAAAVVGNHPFLRDRAGIELPMTTRCWRAIRQPW